jgi:hypothetical protein
MSTHIPWRPIAVIAALVAVVVALALAAPKAMASTSAQGATSAPAVRFCGLDWTDADEEAGPQIQGHIQRARASESNCSDALMLDLGSHTPDPGYHARYTAHCIQDASGQQMPMRGGAILTLTVFAPGAASFPANKANLIATRNPDGSYIYNDFRQIRSAGNFEGISTFCVGLKWRLPFKVTVIHPAANGFRSTVKLRVAHFWNQ